VYGRLVGDCSDCAFYDETINRGERLVQELDKIEEVI